MMTRDIHNIEQYLLTQPRIKIILSHTEYYLIWNNMQEVHFLKPINRIPLTSLFSEISWHLHLVCKYTRHILMWNGFVYMYVVSLKQDLFEENYISGLCGENKFILCFICKVSCGHEKYWTGLEFTGEFKTFTWRKMECTRMLPT